MSAKGKAGGADDWRALSDANLLAEYGELVGDRARMARAMKAARAQSESLARQARAMDKVASSGKARPKAAKASTARPATKGRGR